MTSRDGSNRNNRPIRTQSDQAPRAPQRQGDQWELDAEDLNRYMSGQPSKNPRFDPYGRSQTSGQTERPQPRRTQPQPQPEPEPQYDDYGTYEEDAWVDEGLVDDYQDTAYEEAAPAPARQPQRRQPRPAARQRVTDEPEYYDDDLYEDPFVLDEDEVSERSPRPERRAPRPRVQRQAPNFTIPPAIAEAPIIKDRITLGMMAVLLVSLLAMIIIVATGKDDLGTLIFTHVNANGEAEGILGADAIWNLPLIAGMVTLINGVLAWFISRWGMFLPRFLLGGAIGVHFMVWVSILFYLF